MKEKGEISDYRALRYDSKICEHLLPVLGMTLETYDCSLLFKNLCRIFQPEKNKAKKKCLWSEISVTKRTIIKMIIESFMLQK